VAIDPCGFAEAVWDDDSTGTGSTMFARQTGGTTIRPSACGQSAGGTLPNTTTSGGAGTAPVGLVNTSSAAARFGLPAAAVVLVAVGVRLVGRRRRRRS
jgi:hypothetical protein